MHYISSKSHMVVHLYHIPWYLDIVHYHLFWFSMDVFPLSPAKLSPKSWQAWEIFSGITGQLAINLKSFLEECPIIAWRWVALMAPSTCFFIYPWQFSLITTVLCQHLHYPLGPNSIVHYHEEWTLLILDQCVLSKHHLYIYCRVTWCLFFSVSRDKIFAIPFRWYHTSIPPNYTFSSHECNLHCNAAISLRSSQLLKMFMLLLLLIRRQIFQLSPGEFWW